MTDSVQGASKATPTAAAAAGRDGKPVFLPRSCTNRLAPADIHPTTTRIWPILYLSRPDECISHRLTSIFPTALARPV